MAHAGGDVTALLGAWDMDQSRTATLRIANMVGSADWLKKRLENSFWVGLSRPRCKAAMGEVMRWLLRSQTRRRLEAACLHELDGDAQALLSHAEGIVGGIAGGVI